MGVSLFPSPKSDFLTFMNWHLDMPQRQLELFPELEENELEENELVEPKDEWMINPSTKRRIKIGGKTWNYLKNSGVL